MQIIRSVSELQPAGRRTCLAIGFFDGVHLGHQHIIRQMTADARQHEGLSIVVSFDKHPSTVVAPARAPLLIQTLPQRLRAIETLSPDALLLNSFDKKFSEQTGEDFVRQLACELGLIHSICVGANFVFGKGRGGNVDLLRKLGTELKFTVHGLGAVALEGKPVSSTRIREAIKAGDLDAASQLLGRAYSLAGTVIEGDKLGRQLGFPTANIRTDGLVLPPSGVYAVHAEIAGQTHRAVLNIGLRPTVNNPVPALRVEAHLLDFQGDLYGRELEITFVDKLREEKKFPSLDALRAQIAADTVEARRRF